MNLILNFLPMVLLYLIATYSPQVARISHTVLGKVIAIGLILLYCFFDIVSGLLVCALVIFYYQTDYVESFSTSDTEEGEDNEPTEAPQDEENEQDEEAQQDEENEQAEENEQDEQEPFTTVVKNEVLIVGKIAAPIKNPQVKGHKEVLSSGPGEDLQDAYPLEPTITITNDKKISDFKKKHCSKGHLKHKGQVVNPEMAEHIFPEIKQDDFRKCNVCDPTCRFDIINSQTEKLMKAEENLTKPKSSNDFFEVVWNNIQISKPL